MIGFGGSLQAKKPEHAKQGQAKSEQLNQPFGYGAGGCPPGLRKKNAECMPPGQYKKLFEIGQRVPKNHSGLRSYNALPRELRMRYGGALDPRAQYIYDQQYLYRVDPTTMVVRQILRSLL